MHSTMGRSTAETVHVRGHDLTALLGHVDFGAMAWLELTGQLPEPAQCRMFNALLIALVEHGLTPSAIAARLTLLGAPEAMQAAVAAGLSGLGSVYGGGSEATAKMLVQCVGGHADMACAEFDMARVACRTAQEYADAGVPVPGTGHPLHKRADPRTTRLFDIAQELGLRGRYVRTLELIAQEAGRLRGRHLPINVAGAIGALCCELGLPWEVARGIAVMGRAVGLVGHLAEEMRMPLARELWQRAEHACLRSDPATERVGL